MIYQIYNYYVMLYLNKAGQNLIEYALLLAIMVGVGYLIYSQTGIEKDIAVIFSRAARFIPKTAYTPEG